MHYSNVDSTQAVSRGWQIYDPKVRHCMPFEFGKELGQ